MKPAGREKTLHCPHCGERVSRRLDDRSRYVCPRCATPYRVLVDRAAGDAAFFDESAEPLPEPLGLPRGSIRAAMALAMVATALLLVVAGRPLPGSLTSLLLAIIGFYFGFRSKSEALSDRVYDPAARREQPLYLPAGFIRTCLVLGLAAMAARLLLGGRLLDDRDYLKFFTIVAGLVVGHFFGKLLGRARRTPLRVALIHVKGMLGIAAAAVVAGIFLTGFDRSLPDEAVAVVCATIMFYFGVRT